MGSARVNLGHFDPLTGPKAATALWTTRNAKLRATLNPGCRCRRQPSFQRPFPRMPSSAELYCIAQSHWIVRELLWQGNLLVKDYYGQPTDN